MESKQHTFSAPYRSGRSALRTRLLRCSVTAVAAACVLSAVAVDRTASPQNAASNRDTSAVGRVRRWLQVGQASWYGLHFQGRRTATGEPFDMNSLTCAHRSLPLGSWIRVTNLRNRRSIFVRVNDRGPVSDSRIVDLSYAAAHAVGLNGVGKVKLETVSSGDPGLMRALVAQVGFPQLAPAR